MRSPGFQFMLRAMSVTGVLGRVALAFAALLVLSGVAMYAINPFHSPLRDPRARVLGYMVYREHSLSMAPTFPQGATLVFNTASLGRRDPQAGEIVAFLYPPDTKVAYVKRVIAAGGSTLEIRGGQVWVDGNEISEPYVARETILPSEYAHMVATLPKPPDLAPFRVPEGRFFVMGDNRGNSADSRVWGTVPRELMIGVFSGFLFKGAKDE